MVVQAYNGGTEGSAVPAVCGFQWHGTSVYLAHYRYLSEPSALSIPRQLLSIM